MVISISLLVLNFITVTAPDGRKIEINPEEVVSVREPQIGQGHFAPNVKCVLYTADAKYIGVKETCDQVGKMLAPNLTDALQNAKRHTN